MTTLIILSNINKFRKISKLLVSLRKNDYIIVLKKKHFLSKNFEIKFLLFLTLKINDTLQLHTRNIFEHTTYFQ